jgi:hypothetical protein
MPRKKIVLYSRKFVFLHFLLNVSQSERGASMLAFPSPRNVNEVNVSQSERGASMLAFPSPRNVNEVNVSQSERGASLLAFPSSCFIVVLF